MRRVAYLNLALLASATLQIAAAHAFECACAGIDVASLGSKTDNASSKSENGTVTPPPGYHIERVGNQGVRFVSNKGDNNYAITISGSNTETGAAGQFLSPGETSRGSLGMEMKGTFGAFLNADLTTRFTQVERSENAELFALQPVDNTEKDRRGLQEFGFATKFLGDRITVTSSRRVSSLLPLESEVGDSKGAFEQKRFKAWAWRSDWSSLVFDGLLSRVDSNYQDLTNAALVDALTRNRDLREIRSTLNMGPAGVFVSEKEASTVTPEHDGTRPRQSDLEAGIRLQLVDFRPASDSLLMVPFIALLPDSAWVSTSRGSVTLDGVSSVSAPEQMSKSAIGMTRNWGPADVNVSYWQSDVQAATPIADLPDWRGHGIDAGGILTSGPVSLTGNLSWYRGDNVARLTDNTSEGSVSGSLFFTWARARWPKVSAGITNYAYEGDFYIYDGRQQDSLVRYQLSVDTSPLLEAVGMPAQLTLLASFQGNNSSSRWAQTDYRSDIGNVFVGFRLARASLP